MYACMYMYTNSNVDLEILVLLNAFDYTLIVRATLLREPREMSHIAPVARTRTVYSKPIYVVDWGIKQF